MFSIQSRSKVPGIFLILLAGMAINLLLSVELHDRWGRRLERFTIVFTVLVASVYAIDQIRIKKS
jgi:hypothetical protein